MKKSTLTLTLTTAALALSACTGTADSASDSTATPSAPVVTSTNTDPSTSFYPSLPPSSLGETATPFEALPATVQEDRKAKALDQGNPFLIWGSEVIWVDPTIEFNAPAEHVHYITQAVADYASTPTPVYFISGVGTEQGPTIYLYAGADATSGYEVTYQQYLYLSGLS